MRRDKKINNAAPKLKLDIPCVKHEMIMIIRNLFLGDEICANDPNELAKNNIKIIINVAYECNTILTNAELITGVRNICDQDMLDPNTNKIKYLHVPIKDIMDQNISHYTGLVNDIVNDALKHDIATLIHCKMGVSRSPAFIASYLMSYGFNPDTKISQPLNIILKMIIEKAPNANPMLVFSTFLKLLDKKNGFIYNDSNATTPLSALSPFNPSQ